MIALAACAVTRNSSTMQRLDAKTLHTSARWWKGNLHTHSFWSDGDDFPENIVGWYKHRGYNFLAISDHNILSVGEKWVDIGSYPRGQTALAEYKRAFGPRWVVERDGVSPLSGDNATGRGRREVRLRTLAEFRGKFEEPNRFLLMQSEEISDRFESLPIHLIATNLRELVKPQGGGSVREVMQRNIDAVWEQRRRTGEPMVPHIAHPNFGWAVTAEDMAPLKGERFFEVYNGHPAIRQYGDKAHASTERVWDIILTKRLAELGEEVMYGVAVDDSHNYHAWDIPKSNSGRGWVMVRATALTPATLIAAMEAGDFYATTGVTLKDVRFDGQQLSIQIASERGVSYRTQFIGTRHGYSREHEPVMDAKGKPLRVTQRYSDDIGSVLAEVEGIAPSYQFAGDEIYVRAKMISTKPQRNPYKKGDVEVAWTQPARLAARVESFKR